MGKRAGSAVTVALAIMPFVLCAAASAIVCGSALGPSSKKPDAADSVTPLEPPPPSPSRQITYEPWELVST